MIKYHCWWCKFQAWLFEEAGAVPFVVLATIAGIFALGTVLFVCIVGGATLLGAP